MARRSPLRKVTYFEPVPPRLARNTIIVSTFDVGHRFRCTMRVDCGQIDPGAVIRPGYRRMAPAHARAPRRGGARGLARRPQCDLSARCADDRRASGGRRGIAVRLDAYQRRADFAEAAKQRSVKRRFRRGYKCAQGSEGNDRYSEHRQF